MNMGISKTLTKRAHIQIRHAFRPMRRLWWLWSILTAILAVIIAFQVLANSESFVLVLLLAALLPAFAGLIAMGFEMVFYLGLILPFIIYLIIFWFVCSVTSVADLYYSSESIWLRKNRVTIYVLLFNGMLICSAIAWALFKNIS